MTGPTFYPTHTCFDDAAMHLVQLARENEDLLTSGEYTLCHGIIKVNELTMAHAWIETDEACYDTKIFEGEKVIVEYPKEDFHRFVTEFTRYTIPEAMLMDRKYHTCGPWVEKYQALCGGDRTTTLLVKDGRYMA